MKRITQLAVCVALATSMAWELYAACTANATPDYADGYRTACGCNCKADTQSFTDAALSSSADLATCRDCNPSSTGGCNSTSEHYTTIWQRTSEAATCVNGSCDPIVPVWGASSSHNNAVKYEYLAAGCPK